ncbi:hypothetical protein QJS10_CPB11g00141 [Acorus calamus]|uniref:AT-hook motif nuclear-localized protein n=1 Tax=Acorus calamus TaxID=4465 RepID=A0AAV9DZ55_ACOCL|nr:hypothetical protein QJS10_CPB11g00141 [Acorus calamus]
MALSQKTPRTICVLSASGSISKVVLHRETSSGTVTYTGLKILCGKWRSNSLRIGESVQGPKSVSLMTPHHVGSGLEEFYSSLQKNTLYTEDER